MRNRTWRILMLGLVAVVCTFTLTLLVVSELQVFELEGDATEEAASIVVDLAADGGRWWWKPASVQQGAAMMIPQIEARSSTSRRRTSPTFQATGPVPQRAFPTRTI